jgi:hypothetical protein
MLIKSKKDLAFNHCTVVSMSELDCIKIDLKCFNMGEGSYYLQEFIFRNGGVLHGTSHGQGELAVLFESFEDAKAYFEQKRNKWEV